MQSGLANSQDIYVSMTHEVVKEAVCGLGWQTLQIYISVTHEVVKEAVCSLGWQTLQIYICKRHSRGS